MAWHFDDNDTTWLLQKNPKNSCMFEEHQSHMKYPSGSIHGFTILEFSIIPPPQTLQHLGVPLLPVGMTGLSFPEK